MHISVVSHAASPFALMTNLRAHGPLLRQLMRRDVAGRYRGSALGLVWSFITPLIMLLLYTFVFGIVLKAKWGDGSHFAQQGTGNFALLLFTGLIVHALFAECINRSPSIIHAHVNYVKKVVFPLDILPVMVVGSACFHALTSFAILLMASVLMTGALPVTALWMPVILLPLVMLTLGVAWGLASLGVYLRDIAQLMGPITTVLMFISPVFYPVSALPAALQPLLYLNPITFIIEQLRAALLYGAPPDANGLLLYYAVSLLTMFAGFAWFQKTRKGFADVL